MIQTRKKRLINPILIVAVLLAASFSVLGGNRNVGFIEAVQNTKTSVLENNLPNALFKDWVASSFDKGNEAKWIINDCGEGSSVNNPRSPTCVEVQIPQKNGYYLHISSIIGVTSDQVIVKPKLWMIYFYKGEGYKTLDVVMVKTIDEAIHLYKTTLGEK
jgi:hypothetical protein